MHYGFIPIKWRHLPLRCHFSRKQLFLSKIFRYYFHFWFIFGDKLNSGNQSSGFNRTFNRNVERCVLNIWDELNVMWAFGSCEWKYLGDICTMKGATVQKVVLKTFEGQGLSGLCATFQLAQMLTKIQLHNLDQTSANIVILQIWSKQTKKLHLMSSETCEHMLATRASTCFLHVRARCLFVRAWLLFKNMQPGRVWPSDGGGDLSDFHYVLVMMMMMCYSIWPSVPNIEIRH